MGRNAEQGPERAPSDWFTEAMRWYVQGHQGCACCRGRHCVFRSEHKRRVEYYCTACDFSACHDADSDRYFAMPGEPGDRSPGALLGAEALWEAQGNLSAIVPGSP